MNFKTSLLNLALSFSFLSSVQSLPSYSVGVGSSDNVVITTPIKGYSSNVVVTSDNQQHGKYSSGENGNWQTVKYSSGGNGGSRRPKNSGNIITVGSNNNYNQGGNSGGWYPIQPTYGGNPPTKGQPSYNTSPPPSNSGSSGFDANLMLSLVNQARAKVGAGPLVLNAKLTSAAQSHCEYQASTNTMSHTGAGGSSPFDRIKQAGYFSSGEAENVAYNQKTVEEVMQSWIESPGHYANIVNKTYKEIGVGMNNFYWTQTFGCGDQN